MNFRVAIKTKLLKLARATGMFPILVKYYLALKKVPRALGKPLKIHVYVLTRLSAKRLASATSSVSRTKSIIRDLRKAEGYRQERVGCAPIRDDMAGNGGILGG